MLSATLPNYEALCEWVGSLKRREVFAVATVKRPVPLRHYLYTNEKLYLLVDADGTFNTNVGSSHFLWVKAGSEALWRRLRSATPRRCSILFR